MCLKVKNVHKFKNQRKENEPWKEFSNILFGVSLK